ncbi:MAG: hypothetical protein NC205_07240 [Prevotella sp.]|nr:hypothetical protein [Alistipes senegalensis]MCM1358373.1 hypothetical protein [Prevotella sp.]MCM1472730.1 hypothetical protein [Muribaculaceae bacterium]
MAIDRADWYWDSAEKLYRETHGITGELTETQEDEIWSLSANHIGLFIRWVIENGIESDDADKEDCEKVGNGQMSGTEYLFRNCDGKLWDEDIKEDLLPFIEFYYSSNHYYKDYIERCTNDYDKRCFGVISSEDDYFQLKTKIDSRYKNFLNMKS